MGVGGITRYGGKVVIDADERAHKRTPITARFMIRAGMDRTSPDGYGTVTDISPAGLRLVPDPVVFWPYRDFRPQSTIIMIGAERGFRPFSISGTVARVGRDGSVGIRIQSTTSSAFLKEWIRKEEGD